jgi:hypothetical protein
MPNSVAANVIEKKPKIPKERNIAVRKCFHFGVWKCGTRRSIAHTADNENILKAASERSFLLNLFCLNYTYHY